MSLFVNTNVSSLNAQRQLLNSTNSLGTAFERLSSGFRINRAADDAAGLQISTRLTSQINGLNQAVRNANDAISVVQTADGALDEVTNSLQRIRVLASQSENGINDTADRAALQKEVSALRAEIGRISENTQFGKQNLLDGDYEQNFLVGANDGQTIKITIGDFSTATLGIDDLDLATSTGRASALATIDAALSTVGTQRSDLGALQNRFEASIRNLSNISENVAGARARISDTDFAKETAELTRSQIMQQVSVSVLAQANQRPQTALSLLG